MDLGKCFVLTGCGLLVAGSGLWVAICGQFVLMAFFLIYNLHPPEGDKNEKGESPRLGRPGWVAQGGSPGWVAQAGSSRVDCPGWVIQDGSPRVGRSGRVTPGGSPRVGRPPTREHPDKQTNKQTNKQREITHQDPPTQRAQESNTPLGTPSF